MTDRQAASTPDAPFLGMKSVYSFVFPEVRAAIADFERALDPALLRTSTPAGALADFVARHVAPDLDVPSTPDDHANLDAIHAPITDLVARRVGPYAPGLTGFRFRYPTAGSSEALFHLLTLLSNSGVRRIRVLAGEYEGFGIQAANLGMGCETYAFDQNDRDLGYYATVPPADDAVWFVSNPSARDGDILPDGLVRLLADAGHRIVLDLAYLGSTSPTRIDVSHPNVIAVAMSLSKPYGLFRWRIGYLFSREEVPSLYGSRWFFDVGRHLLGAKVLTEIGPTALQPRYAAVQAVVCRSLVEAGFPLHPSDALLLASMPAESLAACRPDIRALLAPFVRANHVRVCLTPYFEAMVDSGGLSLP